LEPAFVDEKAERGTLGMNGEWIVSDAPRKPEEKPPGDPTSKKLRADTEVTEVTPGTAKKETKVPDAKPKNRLPVDEAWVSGRTDDTLVSLITAFALELKARAQKATERIPRDRPLPSIEADVEVKEFVRLPATTKKKPEEIAQTTWRIVLYSDTRRDKPLGLEIYDNVTLGRAVEDVKVDLDLTEYDAEELGVSRIHAHLRPTRKRLMLSDLNSTNGTHCEGSRVKSYAPVEVKDGNTISLGKLHFKLKIVRKPKKPAK
jgi:hypothetical protein